MFGFVVFRARKMSTIWIVGLRALVLSGFLQFVDHSQAATKLECADASLKECIADLAAAAAMTPRSDSSWNTIAEDLALLGKLEAARYVSRTPPMEPIARFGLESRIAIATIALAARSRPAEAADLAPLEKLIEIAPALGPSKQGWLFLSYRILLLELADAQPYVAIQMPAIRNAVTAIERRPVQRLATIDAVVLRLADLVETMPTTQQATNRIQLADTMAILGELEAARQILAAVGPVPPQNETMLVRSWLQAGNQTLAMAAAAGSSKPNRATTLAEVAASLIKAGKTSDAREAINLAWRAIEEGNPTNQFETFRALVRMTSNIDVAAVALDRAERMLSIAEQSRLFRDYALVRTAAAFNDLKLHQRAAQIVTDALKAVPSPEKSIGTGFISGPATYGRYPELRDDLMAMAAVEMHRSGNLDASTTLISQIISPLAKIRAWTEIATIQVDCKTSIKSIEEILAVAGEEVSLPLFLSGGATCVEQGQMDEGLFVLDRALSSKSMAITGLEVQYLIDLVLFCLRLDQVGLIKKAAHRALAQISEIEDDRTRAYLLAKLSIAMSYALPVPSRFKRELR